jgi:hypothetical protein
MTDEVEATSLSQFDERTRRGLERRMDANPRCPDCWDGPMMHPAHPFGPCQVTLLGGEACGCTKSNVIMPSDDWTTSRDAGTG